MTASFWPDDDRPGLAPYPEFTGEQHCAGDDVNLFFPLNGTSVGHRDAVEICAGCPFAAPCYAYALDRPRVYGIWGGSTHKQRKQARAARGRRAA